MISRRALLGAAGAMMAAGKKRKRRTWPVGWQQDIFPLLIVAGDNGGVFIYNSAGQLIASIAALSGVDPETKTNLIGITSYDVVGKTFGELSGGQLLFGSNAPTTRIATDGAVALSDANTDSEPPGILVASPQSPSFDQLLVSFQGKSKDGTQPTQLLIGKNVIGSTTADLVEIAGDVSVLGNVKLRAVGDGVQIKVGANARLGNANLAGGTVTVANTSVTANTRVLVNHQSIGPNAGVLGWSVNPGVSFTVTSTNAADANSITWMLVEAL